MGWGRYLLFGDLGQQLDLSDQQREMNDLRDELRRMRRSDANATTLAELRAENDELRLYLTALMRLLATKGVVTREELEQIVAAIDAEDGESEGGAPWADWLSERPMPMPIPEPDTSPA